MGDSILSQAEIDALLNGDNTGDEPETVVGGKESEVKPYDPNTQRRVVRERLQALEIINERFCPAVPHGIVQPAAPQPGHHRRADSKFSRTTSLPATCRCRPTLTWYT